MTIAPWCGDNTTGFLTRIGTSGGDVWGINDHGQIFQYI